MMIFTAEDREALVNLRMKLLALSRSQHSRSEKIDTVLEEAAYAVDILLEAKVIMAIADRMIEILEEQLRDRDSDTA